MSTDKTTSQLLAEISTLSDSVLNREWSTGELAGLPKPNDFGALISSANPLANLSSAGVGMLTPHVSFLAKPLDEFRGDSGAVSAPAQGMATAAEHTRVLADTFRQSITTETSGWTGEAADKHRITSAQFADGITAISEAAKTISGAIVGAGEDVVKALTAITGIIGKAVGMMVPVMANGIALAPMTMGLSIGEAITECVGIATEAGQEIAGVMGNLLANAMNLMKLVDMVLTIVHAVTQLLQKLAKLAEGGDTSAAQGTPSKNLEGGEKTATQHSRPTSTPTTTNAAASTGASPVAAGDADSTGTKPVTPGATTGASASPPSDTNQAAALRTGARTGALASPLSTPSPTVATPSSAGPATSAAGAVPFGGAAPMAGAAPNSGTSGVRSTSRLAPDGSLFTAGPNETTASRQVITSAAADASRTGGLGGPMGMGAGARGQGAEDAEHESRYPVDADDAFAADDQDGIAASGVIGATPEHPGEPAP
ncbi:WXG100 family type VII secretion target [Actinokineospora iranica]|uniref:Proteins of 100 residues with WXG n=1 Tax=Actinokineospora iranica TaxID=1271860 RepID=A0A1G6UB68_9PSEU|nr:hypothetical protein [Actinokineospora iranica]SDD38608.1 hypothetical protein SAMN05216174_110195 [Actinokineospora iranica]